MVPHDNSSAKQNNVENTKLYATPWLTKDITKKLLWTHGPKRPLLVNFKNESRVELFGYCISNFRLRLKNTCCSHIRNTLQLSISF